jgi:putrescine aminotransferase
MKKTRGSGKTLIGLETALSLKGKEVVELHKEYVNSSLVDLLKKIDFTRHFVKASGTQVWDEKGNRYTDFLGAYGALNLGHNHPEILEVISLLRERPNFLQAALNPFAGVLAHNLAALAPGRLKRSFFCNSGAEAVEGALKLARISTGKTKILSAINSFHGKSLGALSATGKRLYQEKFLPLIPDFEHFPYCDIPALEKKLKGGKTAAVILEPIQGEGGVIVPPKGYLKKVEELCRHYRALLIIDEIQTGLGRTGTMFACEDDDVEPDILCLAKSLGGGIIPCGAYLATEEVWKKGYGAPGRATLHTSTFGGSTLACGTGIKVLEILLRDDLPSRAKASGYHLLGRLSELKKKHGFIKDVRGRGLLIGLEFTLPEGFVNALSGGKLRETAREYIGALFAGVLMDRHKIITAYTLNNPNVIRLEPPLTVSTGELDNLADAIDEICSRRKSFGSLALSMAKNLFK